MEHILAYYTPEEWVYVPGIFAPTSGPDKNPTLFRQRIDTLPFQGSKDVTFDPSRISTHFTNDHAPTQPPYSSIIASNIFSSQISRGFNSDKLVGRFMAAFTPTQQLKNLNYPAAGAAWNYFLSRSTSFYLIAPSYPVQRLSPEGLPRLMVSNSQNFINETFTPVNTPTFGYPYPLYRVVQPVVINNLGTITTNLTINGFRQTSPNVYEADVRDMPNLGVLNFSFSNTAFATVREFMLNGDSFAPNEPGLYQEAEFVEYPIIKQIREHMDLYPHYGLKDNVIADDSCLSADWMWRRYSNTGQQSPHGGDAWFINGTNNFHPVEPVPNGTMIYWIAIYGGEEPGKRVRHPNGTILAAPVNGKKRIRCAFTLPAEITPIADAGVLLRRCNPTLGFVPGVA